MYAFAEMLQVGQSKLHGQLLVKVIDPETSHSF